MNMSYCRFENTAGDLEDCLDAMRELLNNDGKDEHGQTLSSYELRGMERIIEAAQEIVEIADDVSDLVNEAIEDGKTN